jgi:hypothetical protein
VQVSVRNRYVTLHFDLVNFSRGPTGKDRRGFTAKILRQKITKAISPGMECALLKEGGSFLEGTIRKIRVANGFLVLQCLASEKEEKR